MATSVGVSRLFAVSPHLDDAVFSCAELVARHSGAVVVTAFAGAPQTYSELTDWDAASGFQSAAEAVARRREEDRAALTALNAEPLWLNFCDSQYRSTPELPALAAALEKLLQEQEAATILIPAGLFHSDHMLVHEAMLTARRRHLERHWLMYEDALYRRITGLLQRRLAALGEAGIEATPIEFASSDTRQMERQQMKQQAVQCYASQLRALTAITHGYADIFAPERYWQLGPTRTTDPKQ